MSEPHPEFRIDKGQRADAPTRKGRHTRARILESAQSILEEVGYFDTSVSEITRRADVALGTFYRYFENKDALCLELLERLVTELYASVSGSWTSDDLMENLRNSSLRYLTSYHSNRRLIAAMLQMSGAVPACAALWWDLRKRTYDRMVKYLRGSKATSQLDPDLAASALGSMVEQFANYWYVQAERNGRIPPSLDQAADALSLIWYRAIYEVAAMPTGKY